MRRLTLLGLMTLLLLPTATAWADDPDNLDKDEDVTIGTISADPKNADTPITVVKPPTVLQGASYYLTWQYAPETIPVSEPFTIDLDMFATDRTSPLVLEPGTSVSILMKQRRGYCALLIPATLEADGSTTLPSTLMVPYSGGYEAFIYFSPAGGAEPIMERVAFFVEGVAENGRDITAMPRTDGPWVTMPSYTAEVNRYILDANPSNALENDLISRRVVDIDLDTIGYDDLANFAENGERAVLLIQSNAEYNAEAEVLTEGQSTSSSSAASSGSGYSF